MSRSKHCTLLRSKLPEQEQEGSGHSHAHQLLQARHTDNNNNNNNNSSSSSSSRLTGLLSSRAMGTGSSNHLQGKGSFQVRHTPFKNNCGLCVTVMIMSCLWRKLKL